MAGPAWDHEADVVVLGLGAAGCAAAIEAHDAGASVVVLEKMPAGREGGNTRVSGGVWFDSSDPEGIATYLRALCGEFPVPEEIIQVWAHETARNSAWVEGLGARVAPHGDYRPEFPELPGSESYGGYMGVDGELGNGRLFAALAAAVQERGIEVLLDTPGRELLRDASGAIVRRRGAERGERGRDAAARACAARRGARHRWVREQPGDGARLPAAAGLARLGVARRDRRRHPHGATGGRRPLAHGQHGDRLRLPRARLRERLLRLLPVRARLHLHGMDGRRLMNEFPQNGHGHARLHGRYELYPAEPMHVIFDERTRLAGPISPPPSLLPVGWNMLVEGYEWSEDNSAEIERGWIKRADSPAELAALLDVDGEVLEGAVQRYNEACAAGVDEQFGRHPRTLTPIDQPPYYAFTSAPLLGWTNGGPRRNEHTQVLDPFGRVIPGLYAAGTVSSTYSWCKDGGFHIADALAFGRVAGRTAAAEARA